MSPEPLFGVAGNPPRFFKSPLGGERANAPAWLAGLGLDALEVQCTFGVRMPPDRAEAFRNNAQRHGITLSLHAPYYINLASANPAVLASSFNHLTRSVELAKALACRRVIFHPGSAGKGR
ncbi:MAG: TIM barrel protein, partial [Planctomycetota bacterium]|nr:TIM barrel protein [Planctomycetota bacterium]